MFDLIADVSKYSPSGIIHLKSSIHQALGIMPGQKLYLYAGSQTRNGRRPLYLFFHDIKETQYFITLKFTNINSYIKFSNDLARAKIDIIASKFFPYSDIQFASLIYEIPEPRDGKFVEDINNRLRSEYTDIELVKEKSFWIGDKSIQDTRLFIEALNPDNKKKFYKNRDREVSAGFTVSFANKYDVRDIGFSDPSQIKKCVQIAYPGLCAAAFHFFDDDRIKKVYLGYLNFPGSYAMVLKLLADLNIEVVVSIQKNTAITEDTRRSYTTDLFILKYPPKLDKDFDSNREYFFCWDEIPENESGRLREFLIQYFGVEWVKTATIEKSGDGKTIKVSDKKNNLSLSLNDEKTNVNLRIDDGRTDDFTVKIENGRTNIYLEGYYKLKNRLNESFKELFCCYLFCWDEIPRNESGRLTDFLMQNYGTDWVKTAIIEKSEDDKTIKVSDKKNNLSLSLNDEKTKVNLRIDDGRTDEFMVKTKNGLLNIHLNIHLFHLDESVEFIKFLTDKPKKLDVEHFKEFYPPFYFLDLTKPHFTKL